MKQWIVCLILSGIWLIAAIVNIAEQRQPAVIAFNIFAAVLFAGLGAGYALLSRKYGETGRWKRWLHLSALLMLIVVFIVILLVS